MRNSRFMAAGAAFFYVAATAGLQAQQGGIGTPVKIPDLRLTSQTINATLTSGAGSYIDIPLNNAAEVALRFSGLTASGATITYLSSNDATQTPADTINAYNASTGALSPTRTTDGPARVPVSGRTTLRLQNTVAGTGTITVSYNVTAIAGIVYNVNPVEAAALGTPADAAFTGTGNASISAYLRLLALQSLLPAPVQPSTGSWTNPADISVPATTATSLVTITSSNKFLSVVNTGTGTCRVGYGGVTPAANRGDQLGAGIQRTFESSFLPVGAVAAFCPAAGSFAVMTGQ